MRASYPARLSSRSSSLAGCGGGDEKLRRDDDDRADGRSR